MRMQKRNGPRLLVTAALLLLATPALAEKPKVPAGASCEKRVEICERRIEALEVDKAKLEKRIAELTGEVTETESVLGLRWGMSPARAKKVMPRLEKSPDGSFWLVQSRRILGLDAAVLLVFAKQKLARVVIVFTEKYTNKNRYLAEFDSVQTSLEKKYGGAEADWHWSNDLYADDRSEYGMALAVGHLSGRALWETESMTIGHEISGNNFDVSHRIVYESAALATLLDKAETESDLQDI